MQVFLLGANSRLRHGVAFLTALVSQVLKFDGNCFGGKSVLLGKCEVRPFGKNWPPEVTVVVPETSCPPVLRLGPICTIDAFLA